MYKRQLIGFRLLKTPQKEKILEVSIYDIEPTEPSWHELVEMMKYSYSCLLYTSVAGKLRINYSANATMVTRPPRAVDLMDSKEKLAWEQELWDEYSKPYFETVSYTHLDVYKRQSL